MTSETAWLQVHIHCRQEDASALEGALETAGAVSVTLREPGDEPLLEPQPGTTPLWSRMTITGLFPGSASATAIRDALAGALHPAPLPALAFEALADRAWEREWLKDFRPMRFGQRLWICPHGQSVDAADACVLHLDPGLAFGTGTHPTTALCLQWLDANADPVAGARVLDFGCGSGILGLAAALLGAAQVTCTDIDPQALTATEANRESAGLPADVVRTHARPPADAAPYDIVLANILAGTLVELAPQITDRVRPGGRIVLSGILREQADAVCNAYAASFTGFEITAREEWVRLSASRIG